MSHHRHLLASVLILATQPFAIGQQPAEAEGSASDSQAWRAYYLARAEKDYDFVWSENALPLNLIPNSIMNWTNPLEKGKINGSTFVSEHGGRPVVVGQLFSYLTGTGERSFCHVFSTLTDEAVIGRRNGELFWQPTQSVTGWHVAKETQPPAGNRAGRLLQMRRLARQFQAYTEEASRGKRNLRLLPQPLYRSDVATKQLDSALFAYVVGTDPELLILIESDLSTDAPVWRYRFVQSTRSNTIATLNGQTVYRYQTAENDPESPTAVYLSRHGVEVIPGEFE